jgi:hypothetical protein
VFRAEYSTNIGQARPRTILMFDAIQMDLCQIGHLARTRDLTGGGLSRRAIARLARDPAVRTVRRGLFACAHLPPAERAAVDAGARLDCVSVLRSLGIWAGHDTRLHLRLPPNRARPSTRAVVHYSALRDRADPLRVSVTDALAQAMRCLEPDDVVASLESAVHLKFITIEQLDALIASAPRRLRAVLKELEVGAQSGVETHVRLRLRRSGYRVCVQQFVPGAGHLDNVVEDCVAVETDGATYHLETFEADHWRDLGSEWLRVRVLRIHPDLVFNHWDLVKATIDRMVADALYVRSRGRARRRDERSQ